MKRLGSFQSLQQSYAAMEIGILLTWVAGNCGPSGKLSVCFSPEPQSPEMDGPRGVAGHRSARAVFPAMWSALFRFSGPFVCLGGPAWPRLFWTRWRLVVEQDVAPEAAVCMEGVQFFKNPFCYTRLALGKRRSGFFSLLFNEGLYFYYGNTEK